MESRSRVRLLGVRVGMGALEAIVLGVVPWVAVFCVSFFARKPIFTTQVASSVLLLVGGGLVYFALAVLVASLVSGEYKAPAPAFGIVLPTTMKKTLFRTMPMPGSIQTRSTSRIPV